MLVLWKLVFVLSASAAEPCPPAPSSMADLLGCAEARAPSVKAASLSLTEASLREEAAAQPRNPELGVESFHGSVGGADQSETNFALGIPLELGAKKAARRSAAEGAVQAAEANLYRARAELRADLLLKLHRYRQARHEQEVVEESIGSFSKLVGQFGARASLSPEQETSAAVYRMAKSEYELKKAELLDELARLDSFLLLNTGYRGADLRKILPPSPALWPALEAPRGVESSPRQKALAASVRTAEGELRLARSEAWPTVMIGPSLRLQSQGGASGTLYGFNLGLPLPLFHANGKAKEAASAALGAGESALAFGQAAETRARELAAGIYERSTSLLASTLSHREIERAHGAIERLFARGVVPSPLVIEAHRGYLELERARNEREAKALAALYEIYTIDGRILEKQL